MATRVIPSKLKNVILNLHYSRESWLYSAVSLLAVAAALGLTLIMRPLLQGTPAALFYVAVMVSSWMGGLVPGLFATALSAFALNYFFLEPHDSFGLASLSTIVQLCIFATAACLISYLNETRLAAKRRADANFKAWRESEAQFAHLADANVIGIFEADLNDRLLEANDAFLRILGYTREELLAGRVRWTEIMPPEQQDSVEQFQKQRLRTGVCPPQEQEFVRNNGSRVSVLLGLVTRKEQSITGFVLDRSEFKRNEAKRRQAEVALRESEERLRLAMEGAQMGTWDVDLITGKAIWSEQHFTMLGYAPSPTGEASEILWSDRIHPEDRDRVALEWQQSRQEQRNYRAEYRVIRADNQQVSWLSALGSFIYNTNTGGEAIRSIGVLFDVTERKLDEEALRRSEERFRISQNLSLDAFTTLDSVRDETGKIIDFVWTYVNPKAAEILQHPVEDLIGHRLLQVLPGNQTNSELFERYVRVVETGEPHDLELSYSADGITGWFRNMAVKLNDGISIFFSDITARKQTETALSKAIERFELAANAVNCLIYEWNIEQNTVERNGLFRILGYSPDEAGPSADWWFDLYHPDDKMWVQQAIATASTTGDRYSLEYRLRHKNGHYIDVLDQAIVAQRDATGKPIRQIGSTIDISDRKQAEAALKEREKRLTLATRAANLGVFEWNVQTDQSIWENSRMYEIFGRPPDEGPLNYAAFMNRVVHPEDRQALELRIAEGIEQGSFSQLSCRIRRQNEDQWRWIEFSGQFEFTAEGTPLRLVGVLGDITDRKQAETDLLNAKERLHLALNAARMVVWDWDVQANRVVCSENAEEIWGVQIGTSEAFIAAIHPDDRTLMIQANRVAQQRDGIFRCQYRVIGPDNRVRWLDSRGRTHFNAVGQAERMIGVSIDVSERVQIEAQRDALLRQEQVARAEAERANRIKDEFLAVLSHELRSPLNPILGWTKLLQSRPFTPEKTAQALATIERNAKLQSQLIEDLLDVSRILQGKMVLNICPVNLVTTIESAIETVRLAAEAKQIPIHTHCDTDAITIAGDAARLQQLVWNLLTNAVKFTPQGGRVDVRLSQINGFAQIQVQDTGKGISPEFLPYVFDYFRQEDGATTRKFGGLGLGLALVRHLAEQHGGSVSAESAGENQGATFIIRLPLQTAAPQTEQPPLPVVEAVDLHDLKILVVDDEADMRELTLTILEAQGAEVKVAASADEALTLLEQWQPNLLISDIGMPDIDGYMLLRQIRARSPAQGGMIPAIALTAYAGEIDQQQALAAGYQQHLSKPVEPDELIEAIAHLLNST